MFYNTHNTERERERERERESEKRLRVVSNKVLNKMIFSMTGHIIWTFKPYAVKNIMAITT